VKCGERNRKDRAMRLLVGRTSSVALLCSVRASPLSYRRVSSVRFQSAGIWPNKLGTAGIGAKQTFPRDGARVSNAPMSVIRGATIQPLESSDAPRPKTFHKSKSVVRLLLAASYPAAAAVVRVGGLCG